MTKNIYINLCLVILCLFIFLVGIKGLSKSIEGISSPDELSIGDYVHFKKLTFKIDQLDQTGTSILDSEKKPVFDEITIKNPWVRVDTINYVTGKYKYSYSYKHENVIHPEKMYKNYNGSADLYDKDGDKTFGKVLGKWLYDAMKSPFICLFIGIFATVIFQSSSTTTSLIVAIAGGGLVQIEQAVPMVMGANIGTTVTNTLISMGHITKGEEFKRAFSAATVHDFFNLMAVLIFFPLEIMFGFFSKLAQGLSEVFITDFNVEFKSPIKSAVDASFNQFKSIAEHISDSHWFLLTLSGILTLLMLFSIVKILKSMVLEKVEAFFGKYIFKTAIRAMAFGVVLTILVQSSSITTSTIVPLAGAGVLTLRQIFPFTLGANVGTTVTALLAALVLNPMALTVAFSHLIFNVMGIVVIYPIRVLRNIPLIAANKLSELAIKNKFIPLGYLLVVFILIPLIIIMLGGE
tara:strand:- start:131 stop:1519 length:1389 start_codon:yes stop_codon:yes gene_type:complete